MHLAAYQKSAAVRRQSRKFFGNFSDSLQYRCDRDFAVQLWQAGDKRGKRPSDNLLHTPLTGVKNGSLNEGGSDVNPYKTH
jgi:hypothetical protein